MNLKSVPALQRVVEGLACDGPRRSSRGSFPQVSFRVSLRWKNPTTGRKLTKADEEIASVVRENAEQCGRFRRPKSHECAFDHQARPSSRIWAVSGLTGDPFAPKARCTSPMSAAFRSRTFERRACERLMSCDPSGYRIPMDVLAASRSIASRSNQSTCSSPCRAAGLRPPSRIEAPRYRRSPNR